MKSGRFSRSCLLVWLCAVCLMGASAQPATQPNDSAGQALQRARAAANSGDLATARKTLQAGSQLHPTDPRFPTELAGIAFLERRNGKAKRLLHRALGLGAADPYVNEFLGTLYLLDGNVEAALSLWNAAGGPVLADGPYDTGFEGILRASLAGDAIPFSAGSVLTRDEFLRAERIATLLDVCGSERIVLEAAEDDRYRARLHCVERPSFGRNRVGSLLMLARGLGYQAVHVDLPNIRGGAWSWNSMLRWDARKRRIWTRTAMPAAGRPGWRLALDGDARAEDWRMLASETRQTEQTFQYRREEAGIAVAAVIGPRVTWENRLSLARRTFTADAAPGELAEDGGARLASGASVRYGHAVKADVYRNPFRRITVAAEARASFERYLAEPSNVYRAEGAVTLAWLPRARGDDERVRLRVSAGSLHGAPALPELFAAGLERDGGIPLRGHIGTSGGRKGSALYGDRYIAASLDVEKTLLRLGIVTVSVAPFLDTGWVRDPQERYGARRMQFDAGLEWIAATPGGTEIRLCYAWDLRGRRQSLYASSAPFP